MSTPPAVSVVIPAHDASATLAAQLDALFHEPPPFAFEVVVVDNASTDATARIAHEYAAREPRVRLVAATSGRGPSYARNVGVRAAGAELIACCDADDVVAPGWLAAMKAALDEHRFVAGVLEVDALNEAAVVAGRGSSIPGHAGEFYGVAFAHGCNMGIHRSAYLAAGGLDEQLRAGEEIDLAIRLMSADITAYEARDAVVHYRYRHDPREQWHQAFEGGRVKPHLCRQLRRAGRRPPSRLSGVRNWIWLLRSLPQRHDAATRVRRRFVLASRCGQLAGCIRYRTIYV